MLQGTNELGWKAALYDQNILQTRNPATARRLALLLRGRLGLMDADLGHSCVMAPALWRPMRVWLRRSAQRLAGDFLDLVVREQYQCYAEALSNKLWEAYIVDCQGVTLRCPWSDATIALSAVIRLPNAGAGGIRREHPHAEAAKRSTSRLRCSTT